MDRQDVLNYFSSNRATLNLGLFGNLDINLTRWQIPEVSLPAARQEVPFGSYKHRGDQLEFAPADCEFIVTKNLANWSAIYSYLMNIAPPDERHQKNSAENFDAWIMVYSAQNNPIMKITFKNAIITTLGAVIMGTDIMEADVVKSNLVFEYDYFVVEVL